ncbi:MAG: hypothetical protein AB7T63_17490 [Planctomycetota bacterium]
MSDVSESPRFEISVNGVVAATCGVGGFGMLQVAAQWWAKPRPEQGEAWPSGWPEGMGVAAYGQDVRGSRLDLWGLPHGLQVGDEVRIRVLPPGPISPPTESRPMPRPGEGG